MMNADDDNGSEEDSVNTRSRLLDAACELFSRKGFHNVTHQEICSRANANIAAINYYFGSKDKLYNLVFQYARDKSRNYAAGPPWNDMMPEQALRQYLRSLLTDLMSHEPQGWFLRLLHQEMINPTVISAEVHNQYLNPVLHQLKTLVVSCLGEKQPEQKADHAAFAILSQSLHIAIDTRDRYERSSEPSHISSPERTPPQRQPIQTDAFLDQITEFCLAGLNHLRTLNTPE